MTNRVSRLAPSPTGALHLGNVRTFLVNWALARNEGWTLLMRIEDLDGPRTRPEAARQTLDRLDWLGIDHDGPVLWQSANLEPYREAMGRLAAAKCCYCCDLSRSEIEQAATAPHAGDNDLRYPPHLRSRDPADYRFDRRHTNYRLVVDDEEIEIDDQFAGRTRHRPADEVGDFVIWTKRDAPAYQLAVVVDDARQGVTDVVRGDDLLPSAARQVMLYRLLGHEPPRWWHLPLVIGHDGRRLAKRHGDTRVESYRRCGVRPQRIIGLLGRWCGNTRDRREMSREEFRKSLDLGRLDRRPVTLTQEDHEWLLEDC